LIVSERDRDFPNFSSFLRRSTLTGASGGGGLIFEIAFNKLYNVLRVLKNKSVFKPKDFKTIFFKKLISDFVIINLCIIAVRISIKLNNYFFLRTTKINNKVPYTILSSEFSSFNLLVF